MKFVACCSFFVLGGAFRFDRLLHGPASGKEQVEERKRSEAHAGELFQDAVRGLTDWASKTASLQDLAFMTRFKDWLQDHSSNSARIATALDKLTESPEWSDCANEQRTCDCPDGIVRYGREPTWVYRGFSQPFVCSNQMFAQDPYPGAVKLCQCQRNKRRDMEWIDCGKEGGRCSCGGHFARYGGASGWAYKNFSQEFGCTSRDFGADPLPGVAKACQCQMPSRSGEASATASGPLLWSCDAIAAGPDDRSLAEAVRPFCERKALAGLLEVRLDERFRSSYERWVGKEGWLEEAYVTYMAGKKNSKFEWMATNLVRSANLFSTRPIVAVNFDTEFEAPESWHAFPNLIVYRMRKLEDSAAGFRVSFNFNKIRAMIGARVRTGIQVDLDQVIFAGMDSVFQATRREVTQLYPYPILPVHWMSRDAGDPYAAYRFKAYNGSRSMRWNHAHPTWTQWALPFLSEMLYERFTAFKPPPWMREDEDMLNVMLWKKNASKAWCKFDLEPRLFTDRSVPANIFYDPLWYPQGVPLLFFGAHNTKIPEETDWLITLMARCSEPSFRHRAHLQCSAKGAEVCQRSLMRPSELEHLLRSEAAATAVCCCVRRREDTPAFWRGRWYADASQVPEVDDHGNPRRCLMP